MNQLLTIGCDQASVNAMASQVPAPRRIGIIIPACNEEACLGRVLQELLGMLDSEKYVIAVGVNNSDDRTTEIARAYPVIVAETEARGYGYGCVAAIKALTEAVPMVGAYVFFAGDGASDPRDVALLATAHEQGYAMVLGARTFRGSNWRTMRASHVLANFALAMWCGLLGGRWFTDLAPLRIIDRRLFEALALREMTFGWTIEAQIGAALLKASICEVPAHERDRLGGEQKVSGVTWDRTFSIGCRILAAGWRAKLRFGKGARTPSRCPPAELVVEAGPAR